MTVKFSIGPYEVVKHSWKVTSIYSGESDWPIASLEIDSNVDEDNQDALEEKVAAHAALFSAAPELYEALKAITDCYGVGYKDVEKFVEHVHDFMMEGRAALAKARGEK